jgi:hypothetical protein
MSKHLVFQLLFVLALNASAAPAPESASPTAGSYFGFSGIPVIGYDDYWGLNGGLQGYMYHDGDPGMIMGLGIYSNFKQSHALTYSWEQRNPGSTLFTLNVLGEKSFDVYYGEGNRTPVEDPWAIGMDHLEAQAAFLFPVLSQGRLGVYVDTRAIHSTGLFRDEAEFLSGYEELRPEETTAMPGLRFNWDTRDSILGPKRGVYFQCSAHGGPPAFSSDHNARAFGQALADFRTFYTPFRSLTLASRAAGGVSFGEPGYLFRFRLGGIEMLRGFQGNRFRGKAYYLLQQEFRWRFNRIVALNLGVDAGDITDDVFGSTKFTCQIGLRIGLPPDFGQKARLEIGFSQDQHSLQLQFGEVF